MKSVAAAVTAALQASSSSAVAWYVDIVPRPGDAVTSTTFRFHTSDMLDNGTINPDSHTYGNHLNSSIKWKKTSKQEWDTISVSINICNSGATDSVISDLLSEFAAGTLDQATATFGLYTDLVTQNIVPLEACRIFKIKISDKALTLTMTNELHEFRGMFPKTRHEAQSWERVEDTEDNPIDGNLWEQSSTVLGSANGRFRRGVKESEDRDGYGGWLPIPEDDEDVFTYPWAYGQNLITTTRKNTDSHPFVLSEGQCGDVQQILTADGSISNWTTFPITPSVFDPDARDSYGVNTYTRTDRSPVYTTSTFACEDGTHIVFDGRKHYAYDSSGNKITTGDGFSSSHGGVTNPIWVMVDILMNGLGLLHEQIDWSSASTIAAELLAAEYDLRFILKEPEEIKDIFDKLAKNGSFFWRWGVSATGTGVMYFDRRRASTDAVFKAKDPPDDGVGWMLEFSDAESVISSFNYSDQSVETTPNKFNIRYLSQGTDSSRYYHRVLEHQMTIQDKIYIKENTEDLELEWLYDPLGFDDDGAGNISLPLLETLKEIRMKRVQSRFKVKTYNLNAILLDGADPVRITHSLNSLDLGDPTPQECEVESVQFGGKDSATLTLKPRSDTWFSGDVNASINTNVTWTNTGTQEGDIPSYRYTAQAATSTGSTSVYLTYSGYDIRSLAPGNTLWAANNTYPTADWEHKSDSDGTNPRWQFLGDIESAEYVTTPDRILVTLRANAAYAANALNRVQCQPNVNHTAFVEATAGGADEDHYEMRARLNFTSEWDYAVGSIDNKTSVNGGTVSVDNYFEWVDGVEYMETLIDCGIFPAKYVSDTYPGVATFKLRTRNGVTGTEDISIFSVSEVTAVSSVTAPTDSMVNILDRPFSDFSERGFLVQTDWNSSDNPNATCTIEYDQGDSFVASEGFIYGSAGTPKPVAFLANLFISDTGDAFSFIDDVDFNESISLKMSVYGSDSTTLKGYSYLTLNKVNHMFDNYLGTINKYTGNEGSGMLLATTGWGLFQTGWTKDGDGNNDYLDWSGGIYVYDKDENGTDTSVTRWTRYSKDPEEVIDTYVSSGPSFAVETTGETKLSYFSKDVVAPDIGDFFEAGCLFYTFPRDLLRETYRGEYLLGINKTHGLSTYYGGHAYDTGKYDMMTPTIRTDVTPQVTLRGAALAVLRSETYGDARFRPKVFIQDLAVKGLCVGDAESSTFPQSPTVDTSIVLHAYKGDDYNGGGATFLGGAVANTSVALQFLAFPYTTSGYSYGLKIPSLHTEGKVSGDDRRLKVTTKMGSDTSPSDYYLHLSDSAAWSQMPYETLAYDYLYGEFRLNTSSQVEVVAPTGTIILEPTKVADQTDNSGKYLTTDGTVTSWATVSGGTSTLVGLTDTTISSPANDQVLTYNSSTSKWENQASQSGGVTTLSGLNDTTISSPANDQALIYQSGAWVNQTPTFEDLSDTSVSSPSNGQGVAYSSGTLVLEDLMGMYNGTAGNPSAWAYDALKFKWTCSETLNFSTNTLVVLDTYAAYEASGTRTAYAVATRVSSTQTIITWTVYGATIPNTVPAYEYHTIYK